MSDEAIKELQELFHTLSARVSWPSEPLRHEFEERLERLPELFLGPAEIPGDETAEVAEGSDF